MTKNLIATDGIKHLAKYITKQRDLNEGKQAIFTFPNGFGASLVQHRLSYGGDKGLFEIAVLDGNGDLCFTTELTNDVMGYLTKEDVVSTLISIKNLKPEV